MKGLYFEPVSQSDATAAGGGTTTSPTIYLGIFHCEILSAIVSPLPKFSTCIMQVKDRFYEAVEYAVPECTVTIRFQLDNFCEIEVGQNIFVQKADFGKNKLQSWNTFHGAYRPQ